MSGFSHSGRTRRGFSRKGRWAHHLATSARVTALVAVLVGAACGKQPSPALVPSNVLALIGSAVITTEDFQSEVSRRSVVMTRDEQKELILELVRTETFYARAQAAGYDRDPVLLARFKRIVAAQFEEDQLKLSERPSPPTPAEIEQYYREHQSRYSVPDRVRAALIFVKIPAKASAEKRQALRQKAESILVEAGRSETNGPAFSALVLAHSDDPATRYQGGDCGWLVQGQSYRSWETNLIEAIFALESPGELSSLVSGADGIYIFKLIERKSREIQPLDKIRDAVAYHYQQDLKQRMTAEFEAKQRSGLRIEVNEALLDSLLPPPRLTVQNNQPAPPRLPAR